MLRRVAVIASVVVVVASAACSSDGGGADDGRVHVVAGFARLAEVAERVGGDAVSVTDLTPPGAEPHDLELTSEEIDAIEDADVMLYLGGGFQPGLAEASRRAGKAVDLLAPADGEDPHIWLDPQRLAEVVSVVERELIAVDGARADGYRQRAASVRDELTTLDQEMSAGLATCERRVIVTAHEAFGHLARRYDLVQEPITGISPEAEPDPERLAELADLVRDKGVTTVFTERLVSPRVAEALAREAGVEVAVLDPLEGPVDGGYTDAMRQNLVALRAALACS